MTIRTVYDSYGGEDCLYLSSSQLNNSLLKATALLRSTTVNLMVKLIRRIYQMTNNSVFLFNFGRIPRNCR